MDRSFLVLGGNEFEIETKVPGSDRGLCELFKKEGVLPSAPKIVLLQDELRNLMNKVCIQGSSLGTMLCTLYYKDEEGGSVKNKVTNAHVRLSILGGLKAKDPTEFREVFGSETLGGLYDRFLLVPGPARWTWDNTWTLPPIETDPEFGPADRLRKGWPVTVTTDVFKRVAAWQAEQPDLDRGRPGEMAIRIAAISASMNCHESTISPTCIDAALRLMEWQERVKQVYAPSEARNPDAVLTGEMLTAFEEAHEAQPHSWVRFRDLARKHHWSEKFGPVTTRVRDSLVRDGFLEEEAEEDDRGNKRRAPYPRYRLMTFRDM